MALLLDFVVQTKRFSDPPITPISTTDGITAEKQSRNYVAGRMRKKDSPAKKLIEELASRVVRPLLFVYHRETQGWGPDQCVFQSGPDCWVTRH